MRHDRSYKALFSNAAVVQDLLCDFIAGLLEGGEKWMRRLDFSTLEPLPTELVDETLRARANDAMWRVRFRESAGTERGLYVLVMVEFQSSVDWFMALRVQGYAMRQFESYVGDRPPTRKDRLPPLLAIVFYNGKTPWQAELAMGALIGEGTRPVARGRRRCDPQFSGDSYVLVDVGTYKERSLPARNLVSVIVAMELMSDVRMFPDILKSALKVLPPNERRHARKVFLAWFRRSLGRGMIWSSWRTVRPWQN